MFQIHSVLFCKKCLYKKQYSIFEIFPVLDDAKSFKSKTETNCTLKIHVSSKKVKHCQPKTTVTTYCLEYCTSRLKLNMLILNLSGFSFLLDCHVNVKIKEVAQGDIFMEQKMRFWLVLGRLAILKKNWGPIMSNFWGFFFMFSLAFFFKYCSVRTNEGKKN